MQHVVQAVCVCVCVCVCVLNPGPHACYQLNYAHILF
jgi:hypothetical protein